MEHAKDLASTGLRDLFGGTTGTWSDVQLGQILQSLAKALGDLFAARSIDLELDLEDGLPPVALVAEGLLAPVLLAPLWNSYDTLETGGTVRIVARLVDARVVEVDIDDDGPGIPKEIAASVFEEGVTTKEDEPDRGVGLYFAREILEAAGGSIEHLGRTSENGGCRMRIRLPVAESCERPHDRGETPGGAGDET